MPKGEKSKDSNSSMLSKDMEVKNEKTQLKGVDVASSDEQEMVGGQESKAFHNTSWKLFDSLCVSLDENKQKNTIQ